MEKEADISKNNNFGLYILVFISNISFVLFLLFPYLETSDNWPLIGFLHNITLIVFVVSCPLGIIVSLFKIKKIHKILVLAAALPLIVYSCIYTYYAFVVPVVEVETHYIGPLDEIWIEQGDEFGCATLPVKKGTFWSDTDIGDFANFYLKIKQDEEFKEIISRNSKIGKEIPLFKKRIKVIIKITGATYSYEIKTHKSSE
jgi:hypothetical protein